LARRSWDIHTRADRLLHRPVPDKLLATAGEVIE